MSLFDDQAPPPREPEADATDRSRPLAERMRPRRLAEVIGQEEVVGPRGFLARAIAADRVPSLVFWGPPGSGKTTLARIIARETRARFQPFSAVTSGIKEVKELMAEAARLRRSGQRTLVFVDEIHRFNRAQQDAFLPYVERGDVVLVGATTENPSFEVNAALLSRCRVVVLQPLGTAELVALARRALTDPERGLGEAPGGRAGGAGGQAGRQARGQAREGAGEQAGDRPGEQPSEQAGEDAGKQAGEHAGEQTGRSPVEATDEGLAALAQLASGDARRLLNLLETVVAGLTGDDGAADEAADRTADEAPDEAERGPGGEAGRRPARLDEEAVRRVAQRKVLLYDKAGEEHFNLTSALHKSLRESDPDAALYWLARQLASGEDPLYLARRMVRFASEDVGLADPQALPQTLAAWDAFHRLGAPEGELALAQAAVYLALAPKSDGLYAGYKAARRAVEERPADPVPMQIRNAPTRLMKDAGYGAGYVYAHAEEEGVGGIDCLPDALVGTRFYQPKRRGFEAELGRRLEHFRELRETVRRRRT